MKTYVTIDIGGTAIKHGVLFGDHSFAVTGETQTQAQNGGPAILQKVVAIIEQYRAAYPVSGICVSTAGVVDVEQGEIVYADRLIPNYAGVRIKETIESQFHLPCEVENDVNCAALSEYHIGAARNTEVSVCLTVGTGIGGCILIGGKVLHGHAYSAGEIGHMNLCGKMFQEMGAASVLVRRVAERKNQPVSSLDGKIIFDLAREGDRVCEEEIDKMVDVLGHGIANVCCCVNPEVVVLGGGIMAERAYLAGRIRTSVDRYLVDYIARRTRIAFAENKNYAGMLGAYFHFQERQK